MGQYSCHNVIVVIACDLCALIRVLIATIVQTLFSFLLFFFSFFCYSFIINSGARSCVSAFLFFVDKKVLSCSFLSTNSLTFKCKCVDGFPFRNERDHSYDFMSSCLFFSFGYPVCYTVCRRRFKCFFDEHVHSFSSLISCVPNKLIQFEHDELSSTTNKRNNNETNKWQL